MADSQISDGMVLSSFLQDDRIQLFDFGILEVHFHDGGVARREYSLGDAKGQLEIIGCCMVEVVVERLQGVLL
jgi:hypothetical protein